MSQQHGHLWAVRYLRVGAALLLGLALLSWVTPVNVRSANLVPFGCGSPAAPRGGELAAFLCATELNRVKTVALVLLLSAGLLLLLSEVIIARVGSPKWLLGLTVSAPLAIPLLAWSVASLFIVVGTEGADGLLIRCGTAVAPATDSISTGLCGQLAEHRLSMGVGGALLGAGALAGAAYVGHGMDHRHSRPRPPADSAQRSLEPDSGVSA